MPAWKGHVLEVQPFRRPAESLQDLNGLLHGSQRYWRGGSPAPDRACAGGRGSDPEPEALRRAPPAG